MHTLETPSGANEKSTQQRLHCGRYNGLVLSRVKRLMRSCTGGAVWGSLYVSVAMEIFAPHTYMHIQLCCTHIKLININWSKMAIGCGLFLRSRYHLLCFSR